MGVFPTSERLALGSSKLVSLVAFLEKLDYRFGKHTSCRGNWTSWLLWSIPALISRVSSHSVLTIILKQMELKSHHVPRVLGTTVTQGDCCQTPLSCQMNSGGLQEGQVFLKSFEPRGPDIGSLSQQMRMCTMLKMSHTLVWLTHCPLSINRKMSLI